MQITTFGFLGFDRDRRNAECERYHVTVLIDLPTTLVRPMKIVQAYLDEEVLDMEIESMSHSYNTVDLYFNIEAGKLTYPEVNKAIEGILKGVAK